MNLFQGSEYWMQHSHCVLNDPTIISWHVLSDALIALSYIAIPICLLWTSWRYRISNPELRGLILHGGMFIIACASTHIGEIVTWWTPAYVMSGILKGLCALVSVTFIFRMVRYLRNHPLRSDP